MVNAYVLIKANTSEVDRVKSAIKGFDGIERADVVAGDVDFIATLSVDSPATVKDVVATGIGSIDGIEDTQTYIAMT